MIQTDNRQFWRRRTFWGFMLLFASYGMDTYGFMAGSAPFIERCAYAMIGWGMYHKMSNARQ
jgi:hypothetical protein